MVLRFTRSLKRASLLKLMTVRIFKFWAPVFFWAIIIFWFSSLEFPPGPPSVANFIVKKTAHLVEYAVFFVLLYRAFINAARVGRKKAAVISFLVCVLYAASDEYHQTFTAGRTATYKDVGFDAAGAGLAWFLIWKYLAGAPAKLKRLAESLQLG